VGIKVLDMSTLEKTIGHKIREVRVASRLTQEAFANEIGVHPSYVGPMEKGRKRPSVRTLIRIAERFGVPVHEFFLNPAEVRGGPLKELNELLLDRNVHEQRMVLDMARAVIGRRRDAE